MKEYTLIDKTTGQEKYVWDVVENDYIAEILEELEKLYIEMQNFIVAELVDIEEGQSMQVAKTVKGLARQYKSWLNDEPMYKKIVRWYEEREGDKDDCKM
jgi:hypothetical protein